MDSRKLQQVGGGTFTVSVPKEWAERHGVDPGSEVHVYTHADGSLIVRTARSEREPLASVEFELDESRPGALTRALRAGYRAGFETVTVRTAAPLAPRDRREVTDAARNATGVEIVRAADTEITVRCVLDPATVSLRQTLDRLEFVTRSMHRSALDALEDGGVADPFVGRDDEAVRLIGLIDRYCNRSLVDFDVLDRLGIDRTRLFEYRATAGQLEQAADAAVEIARSGEYADEPPAEAFRSVRSVAETAREVVSGATNAVLESEGPDTAGGALRAGLEAGEEALAVERALFERSPAGVAPLTRALRECRRTADCGVAIAEIALQRTGRDEP